MRNRSTEEREDGVSHEARKGPLVAVHRGDQILERPIHDLGPLLRIEPLGGGGRSFDVAEEHRDDSTLPVHASAAARRLQLLEQLGRNVLLEKCLGGLRRLSCFGGGRWLADRMTTVQTELRLRRKLRSAVGARGRQRQAARHAEFGLGGIIRLTATADQLKVLLGKLLLCRHVGIVDIAPGPVFARIGGPDDRVAGLSEVVDHVVVLRAIATPDEAADRAVSRGRIGVSHGDARLANVGTGA